MEDKFNEEFENMSAKDLLNWINKTYNELSEIDKIRYNHLKETYHFLFYVFNEFM